MQAFDRKQLSLWVEDWCRGHRVPGLALAVFDGSRWWRGYHGCGGDTRFPLASVSKTFTAALLRDQVAGGRLEWDVPLRNYLPGFRMYDARATERLTLRDVLCHRFGLPPHTFAWIYPGCDRATFVRERLPHLAACAPFDAGYRYSNIGYALAGYLLEVVTGRSWEAHVTELLSSGCLLGADWHRQSGVAPPHRGGEAIPPFYAVAEHPIAPASELQASLEELIEAQPWPELEQVKPEVLIRSGRSDVRLGALHYGLGWRVETLHGHALAWHSGSCSGYSTLVATLVGCPLRLIALCNEHGVSDRLRGLAYAYFEEMLGVGGACAVGGQEGCPSGAGAEAFVSPGNLGANFCGRFHHPGYGMLAFAEGRMRFNGVACATLRDGYLYFDRYAAKFPVVRCGSGLEVPFEPALPSIRFAQW